MRTPRTLSALILGGLILGGCTLVPTTPLTTQPDSSVPFNLLAPTLPLSPSQRVVYTHEPIYLLSPNGSLVSVNRLVPAPASLFDVVYQLPLGPSAAEASRGLSTRVPADTVISSATLEQGVATLDVSSSFALVTGLGRRIAVAQLLLSAAAWGPVSALQVDVDHEALPIPVGVRTETTMSLSEARAFLAPTPTNESRAG